jgi:mRNA-degrading endonuclease YafQ of YafQ-DinJ toxin-antitoxin module
VFTIVATQYFPRRARNFLEKHPDLRARFADVVDDLGHDPFAPHLAYHHLGGNPKGIQAVSVTDHYRITLTISMSDKEIILLDIGSHGEVYR